MFWNFSEIFFLNILPISYILNNNFQLVSLILSLFLRIITGLKEYKWKRNISICPILKSFHLKSPSIESPLPDNVTKFFQNVNKPPLADKSAMMMKLETHSPLCANVDKLTELLKLSVETRVVAQPPHCMKCQTPCTHCKTGVLFSGKF